MPATFTTKETFPKATSQKPDVQAQLDLEIKAGAIRGSITDDGTNWILTTEWNVIGEND
ncbi:MAG: hypothetical protein ACLQBA_13030 [Candidatus Binataceae bacterium]